MNSRNYSRKAFKLVALRRDLLRTMQTAVRRTAEITKAAATMKIIIKRFVIESEADSPKPEESVDLRVESPFAVDSSTKMTSIA